MFQRLWLWLFPPDSPRFPIEDEELAGEVRQAQQRLASSSRLVSKKAKESAKQDRATLELYQTRLKERQDALDAAESALNVIRGEHDHK